MTFPCNCCGCIYFSDTFLGRDEIGDNWTQISSSWEIASDDGVSTASDNANLRLNVAQPGGSSPAVIVSADVTARNGGDTAKLHAAFVTGSLTHFLQLEFATTAQAGRMSIWKNNTRISDYVSVPGLVGGSDAGASFCISPDGISGSVEVRLPDGSRTIREIEPTTLPPYTLTSINVAIGTGTVNGKVTFTNYKATEHANDEDSCPDCGGCIPCRVVPSEWQVTLAGFTGLDPCCDSLNDTYVLSNPTYHTLPVTFGECRWQWLFVPDEPCIFRSLGLTITKKPSANVCRDVQGGYFLHVDLLQDVAGLLAIARWCEFIQLTSETPVPFCDELSGTTLGPLLQATAPFLPCSGTPGRLDVTAEIIAL